MNPLYESIRGMNGGVPQQVSPPSFNNPMQKMNYILQAMKNPAAFVKQHFPDIPNEIANDPNKILGYLQQTRGISNQQIQNAQYMAGQFSKNELR